MTFSSAMRKDVDLIRSTGSDASEITTQTEPRTLHTALARVASTSPPAQRADDSAPRGPPPRLQLDHRLHEFGIFHEQEGGRCLGPSVDAGAIGRVTLRARFVAGCERAGELEKGLGLRASLRACVRIDAAALERSHSSCWQSRRRRSQQPRTSRSSKVLRRCEKAARATRVRPVHELALADIGRAIATPRGDQAYEARSRPWAPERSSAADELTSAVSTSDSRAGADHVQTSRSYLRARLGQQTLAPPRAGASRTSLRAEAAQSSRYGAEAAWRPSTAGLPPASPGCGQLAERAPARSSEQSVGVPQVDTCRAAATRPRAALSRRPESISTADRPAEPRSGKRARQRAQSRSHLESRCRPRSIPASLRQAVGPVCSSTRKFWPRSRLRCSPQRSRISRSCEIFTGRGSGRWRLRRALRSACRSALRSALRSACRSALGSVGRSLCRSAQTRKLSRATARCPVERERTRSGPRPSRSAALEQARCQPQQSSPRCRCRDPCGGKTTLEALERLAPWPVHLGAAVFDWPPRHPPPRRCAEALVREVRVCALDPPGSSVAAACSNPTRRRRQRRPVRPALRDRRGPEPQNCRQPS